MEGNSTPDIMNENNIALSPEEQINLRLQNEKNFKELVERTTER